MRRVRHVSSPSPLVISISSTVVGTGHIEDVVVGDGGSRRHVVLCCVCLAVVVVVIDDGVGLIYTISSRKL